MADDDVGGGVSLFRMLVIVTAAAVLSACGGDSEPAATAPAATTEASDPREGYFTSVESKALNPSLGRIGGAWSSYRARGEACNEEAQRLFDEGASPRRAVRCHLEENRALIDATDEVRAAFEGLSGDYREECKAGVERFMSALDEVEGARQEVLDGYERYAETGEVARGFRRESAEADERTEALLGAELVALTEACYTEEDREQAAEDADG